MATYSQGINMTQQFVSELNTLPANEPEEDYNDMDNLDLFTHTQFFDFETQTQNDFKPAAESSAPSKPESALNTSTIVTDYGVDFSISNGEFNYGEYSSAYHSPTLNTFGESLGTLSPIQQNAQAVYSPQSAYANHTGGQPKPGHKRRASEPRDPSLGMNMEEVSRIAAEEDKRRRNTAASARFRVKKKQREQALEKNAKEMSEKVAALEQKISQLETENQWLKKLVIEKNEGSHAKMEPPKRAEPKQERHVEDEIIAKTDETSDARKIKPDTSA